MIIKSVQKEGIRFRLIIGEGGRAIISIRVQRPFTRFGEREEGRKEGSLSSKDNTIRGAKKIDKNRKRIFEISTLFNSNPSKEENNHRSHMVVSLLVKKVLVAHDAHQRVNPSKLFI